MEATNLLVYPNPFSSELTLQSTKPFTGRLVDVMGRTVWTGNIQQGTTELVFGPELLPGWYALVNEEGQHYAILIKR
jgi:hypothetical protein